MPRGSALKAASSSSSGVSAAPPDSLPGSPAPTTGSFRQPYVVNSASAKASSSTMGSAPWYSSRFAPREFSEVMEPGTTHTSRPAARASSAVEKVPDGSPASTMSVARDMPAMSRLRSRKV